MLLRVATCRNGRREVAQSADWVPKRLVASAEPGYSGTIGPPWIRECAFKSRVIQTASFAALRRRNVSAMIALSIRKRMCRRIA